jgi:hypothetical protein
MRRKNFREAIIRSSSDLVVRVIRRAPACGGQLLMWRRARACVVGISAIIIDKMLSPAECVSTERTHTPPPALSCAYVQKHQLLVRHLLEWAKSGSGNRAHRKVFLQGHIDQTDGASWMPHATIMPIFCS